MGSSHLKLVGTTTMKLLVAIALAAVGVAAEPGFYRGYAGYYGGHRGYGHYLGKRSADADAEPGFHGRYYGGFRGGYRGYGGYGYYRGKRSADAEGEPGFHG